MYKKNIFLVGLFTVLTSLIIVIGTFNETASVKAVSVDEEERLFWLKGEDGLSREQLPDYIKATHTTLNSSIALTVDTDIALEKNIYKNESEALTAFIEAYERYKEINKETETYLVSTTDQDIFFYDADGTYIILEENTVKYTKNN
jgi:hypothetical protein